jgi:hypothetical protein
MTLDLKRGTENVLRALQHHIAGELPSDIDTANNSTSATLIAYTKGPYTFDGSKKISITRNAAASPTEYTPAADTYTAAQLAALLNGDATFGAALTADTVQAGSYLRIYDTTRATAGSLSVEDETGNAVLGWNEGYTANYMPLRDLAEIEIRYENVEPVAYPALHMRVTDMREVQGAPQMREYDVAMRLYEASQSPPFGDALYINLARYGRLIVDLLTPATGSRSLGGQVNGVVLLNHTPGTTIETGGELLYRAFVDFTLAVQVQED